MAAVCDPKALPSQAACFHCASPGQLKEIQLYLLSVLSGITSAAALGAGAATYRPLQGKLALAAEVYLLATITGQSTSPGPLMKAAACFYCDLAERRYLETYLLAVSAGGSTDPKVLGKSTAPYRGLIPEFERVRIYALNVIAGNIALNKLMAGAACLTCLEHGALEEILLFLLCQGVSSSLIPPNATYNGNPPEFDLVVLPNTNYVITWGSNDLSMTLCGVNYPSTGVGPANAIAVYTGSCTLMQFFGQFAGTKVTAKVQISPRAPVTGFLFQINPNGANVTASWDPPAAGVTKTEVWVSSDNVNFSLQTTVAAPGTSATFASPGAASQTYCKVRWVNPSLSPPAGGFTVPVVAWGAVADWAARVITNGGLAMTQNTVNATNTFYGSLVTIGISKFKHMSVMAQEGSGGDNGCFTPLIKVIGIDPWSKLAGTFGTTAVAGYTPFSGTPAYMSTGINPNTDLAAGNWGISYYLSANSNVSAQEAIFGSGANTALSLGDAALHNRVIGNGYYMFGPQYNNGTGFNPANLANATYTGFLSVNRVSQTDMRLYTANSTTAFQQLALDNSNIAQALPTAPLTVFGANFSVGGQQWGLSQHFTVSFFAVHTGLSSADCQSLFNAVQTLRTAYGGGFS